MTNKLSPEKRIDLTAGLIAVVAIIIFWFAGANRSEKDIYPVLKEAAGNKVIIGGGSAGIWLARDSASDHPDSFISPGTGEGYGGEMRVVTVVDALGYIERIIIHTHRETESFMKKVIRKGFLAQFEGLPSNSELMGGKDIDIISGATLTSAGLAMAIRDGAHKIALTSLGLEVPPYQPGRFILKYIDIAWLALLVLAFITATVRTKRQPLLRWTVMIISLFVLGFQLNAQLSISQFNKAILGYWPEWHTQLYFYIMLLGLLSLILFTGKNHYCDRICPFGTVQEIIGKISGAKTRNTGKFGRPLKWIQRLLALALIITALIGRNPSQANYEVFGAMFKLTGNTLQFSLLLLAAIGSLIIRRPWCGYLCPVRPVNDFAVSFRSFIKTLITPSG